MAQQVWIVIVCMSGFSTWIGCYSRHLGRKTLREVSISLRRTAESRRIERVCFTFSPSHLGASLSSSVLFVLLFCLLLVLVGVDGIQVFCMAFAKGQLGLLSLDHRRLDDRQSLGARTAAAQKKNVPTYFSRLIAGAQQNEPSPRKSTVARPQRCRAWADVEETSCLNSCSKLIKRHDVK